MSPNAKSKHTVKAFALMMKGLPYSEIAAQCGISRQRVQQLVSPPKAVRTAIIDRANGKCEQCGIVTQSGHIHHKECIGLTPDTFNGLDNLQYLCVGCHQRFHALTQANHGTNAKSAKFYNDNKEFLDGIKDE